MIYKQIISKIPLPSTVFSFKNYFNCIERERKRNIIKMNAYACENINLFPIYKEAFESNNVKRVYKHSINYGRHFRKKSIIPYDPRRSSLCYKHYNTNYQMKVDLKHLQSISLKLKEKNNIEITDNTIYKNSRNPISSIELINETIDLDLNKIMNNDSNSNNISDNNNIQLSFPISTNNNNLTSREILLKTNYHTKYPSMALNSNKKANISSFTNKQKDKFNLLKPNSKRQESNDFREKEKKLFERKIVHGCQGITNECQSLQSFLSKTTRHQMPLSISNEESIKLLQNENDVMIKHLQSAKRRQKKTFSIHTHLYNNARAVQESACLSKLNVNLALNANKILKTMIFKKKLSNKYKEYNNTDYKTLMNNHDILYQTTMKLIKKNQKAIKKVKTKFIQYNVK